MTYLNEPCTDGRGSDNVNRLRRSPVRRPTEVALQMLPSGRLAVVGAAANLLDQHAQRGAVRGQLLALGHVPDQSETIVTEVLREAVEVVRSQQCECVGALDRGGEDVELGEHLGNPLLGHRLASCAGVLAGNRLSHAAEEVRPRQEVRSDQPR